MIAEFIILAGMVGPQPCDVRQAWEEWLQTQYNERYSFSVVTQSGTQTEVWIDPNEGDWTMLGVAGDQLCEIIYGTDWPEGRR